MMASLTHELRTPLNANDMALVLMEDHLTPAGKKYCRMAKNATRMLNSLIDDILDFSRIECGAFQLNQISFRFGELLAEIEELFSGQVETRGIGLRIVATDELRKKQVITDRKRLGQVLLNLVSNALKFTLEGGITVEAEINEQCLLFSVADTGIGISEENMKNLFKLFGKIDESKALNKGGVGLGLTICEKIVK